MNIIRRRHIESIIFGGMICIFSSCNNFSVSENQAESFIKYYPVDITDNSGTTVIQSSDGGYAILGNYENVSGQKDIFIIITDEFGRQKTGSPYVIGTALNDHGYSMISVDDGYIISGTSSSGDQKMGYLSKISNDGRTMWQKNFSGYQEMEFRHVAEARDGNLILTGYGKDDTSDREVILFKASYEEGDSIWNRRFLYDGYNDVGEAIIEYQNRYHIITTSTHVNNTRLSQIRMLNTNTDGRFITALLIDEDYLSGNDIAINAAGNMYILGNREDPVSRVSEIYVAELVLTGPNFVITNLGNSTLIPDIESLHAESFAPVGEDALAIGGWQNIQSDNDILFLQVDNSFQVMIRKTFGSTGFQASRNIIYTSDQGFALAGSVDLGGGRTSMLLKLDYAGDLK